MTYKNLTFSANNHVEQAALTSTPSPVTTIEYLRDSFASRRTSWVNPQGDIVIEGVLDAPRTADYFAIPGSNLRPEASVKLELFSFDTDTVPIVDTGFQVVGDIIPEIGAQPFDDNRHTVQTGVYALLFLVPITYQRFRLTINPALMFVPPATMTTTTQNPPVTTTTTVPDGIFRQGSNGVLSLESGSGEVTSNGLDTWETFSDGAASGGSAVRKADSVFYWNPNEGPRVTHTFTASQGGSHDIWVRVKSAPLANSFYMVFDGNSRTIQMPTNYSNWTWHKTRTVSLTAEQQHLVVFAARDFDMQYDKLVIQPAGNATPSGAGPAESGFGTTTETTVTQGGVTITVVENPLEAVQIRMLMIGNTFELEHNFERGSSIRYMTPPDIRKTHSGRSVLAREQRRVRSLSLNLPVMTENDRDRVRNFEARMAGRPFLVSAFPDRGGWLASDHLFLARFESALDYNYLFNTIHSTQLELSEV